jgi:hypothetical protein
MVRLYHKTLTGDGEVILQSGFTDGQEESSPSGLLAGGVQLTDNPPAHDDGELVLAVDINVPEPEIAMWEVHQRVPYLGRRWCIPSMLLNRIATTSRALSPSSTAADIFEPADPVLPPNDLLQIHFLTAGFVKLYTGQPPSLEEVQQALSDIRLRMSVPEPVRHTFSLSKRLYLFGYFEYGFFTISQHYAFLALEAAVYSRWVSELPPEVEVHVPPNAPYKMYRPTHQQLFDHWMASGRRLKVEGQEFPNSVHKVLGRFVAKGMITAEQRERMGAAMHLRNEMSHTESQTINIPNIGTLAITAELVNAIYNQ